MHRHHTIRTSLLVACALLAACSAKKEDPNEETPSTIGGLVQAAGNVHTVHTPYYTRFALETGAFEEMPSPSLERTVAVPHAVGDDVYLLGGFDNSANVSAALERYDAATETWTVEASRPDPALAFDVVLGKKICGIGGLEDWSKPIRRTVDCFDTDTKAWAEGADVPVENAFFGVVAHAGFAYVFGGLDKDSRQPLDTAWRYDAASDEWKELARLPLGFFAGAQVVMDGKIYLVGGYKRVVTDASPSDAPKDTSMLAYDIATDTWETLPDMPHARLLYGAAAVKGRIAVYLGLASDDTPTIETFDPTTKAWQAGAEPDLPRGAGGYTSVEAADQLYFLFLGSTDTHASKEHRGELTLYDPDANAWSQLGRRSTDYPYANFIGAATPGYLHFIGANTTIYY